ncbi:conserved phage C-terminal domain-containing protein [Furfurilactobacillus curtus]|uniref:Phage conserved hypothetical protein C-terminal domain-containing protein n=1 Tax=Furfurilactobacillus curtus TaxID=1746200 RepID=A0ABQ5JK75_9LACO
MADEGWIKVYRSIRSNWLWEEGNERYLKWWLDILLMVNHKPKKAFVKGHLVEVGTGEKVTSIVKLSERWGVDRKVARRFLELLEQDDMISRSSSVKNGTRLKVNNYADYQAFKSEKEQVSPHVTPQVSPHKQELKEYKEPIVDFGKFMEFFNRQTGKHFRNVETNRKLICARLNDGYSKSDLAKVVNKKAAQWKNDPKMNQYLRPSTLFAPTHFENYLNEPDERIAKPSSTSTVESTKDDAIQEALEMSGWDVESVINQFESDPDVPITREDIEQYVQRNRH